ncbi:MAG: hypothetical protein G01um101413_141 [Parcubacteria group bacterium Gr01-1014_13]|nr:MAG: hypothetical protein G01um101413_141 [Parcubacteria group bacterium Gr01-1014_13]
MVRSSHIIDLDADACVPDFIWSDACPKDHPSRQISVARHRRIGRLAWDPSKLWLYRAIKQTDSNPIYGHHLWDRDLVYRHVLNANVLDYLLTHQELIPPEWKNYEVYFWGTTYKDCNTPPRFQVRYVTWDWELDEWQSWSRGLNSFWNNNMPAAILDF